MENQTNIIAVRKQDISLARQAFDALMQKTERILNDDARLQPAEYKRMSAFDLESCSLQKIKQACDNTPFDADNVMLVSGQRFPDIVADKYYGIEIKSTKQNHWVSTGSSIVESTRDANVEDIYMLFGKMGGQVPEFMCKPYDKVLYDIAVTHSPRYLINMETPADETIFAKMGTSYNAFRTSPDSIEQVRRYYRNKAKMAGKSEMPWWITNDNAEAPRSFNISLWSSLSPDEKHSLMVKCMILFPEALAPNRSTTKYNQTTLWLCSYNQVVNPNIRDMYSAGGKISHADGVALPMPAPQVFAHIVQNAYEIRSILSSPDREMLEMIKEFNPDMYNSANMYAHWFDICCAYAAPYNIPLSDWVRRQPVFSFSK